MYRRGDIVSFPFPFTDLSQTKLRPALIVSNDNVNNTTDAIVVMITSIQKAEAMSIVVKESAVTVPLPKNSFVRCNKVVTVSQALILKTISTANVDFVDKVADKIRLLIGNIPLRT